MAINDTTVILDAGHGKQTSGKCSPDGSIKEYAWAREIVKMLSEELNKKGIKTHILVQTDDDVHLNTRCKNANAVGGKSILISVHINAAGADSKWHSASGWSVWISSKNASANSKKLAQCLQKEAENLKLTGNRSIPPCKYWEGNFAIVGDTNMPAVLTENMFMDNKQDAEFLKSEAGKKKIVELHVNGILKYLQ